MLGKERAWKVASKWTVIVFTVIIVVVFSYTFINVSFEDSEASASNTHQRITEERNTLSRQLNDMKKTVGQMQCESAKGRTSENGGWCRQSSKEDGGGHRTDKKLIPALSDFLQDKEVASFGDGPGAYKRELLKLGQVKSYTAYDGAPFCEETSKGRVQFMDLTIPQFGIPVYDWVMSLEVAEHIPQKYEATYLDNIFRHAKEGIILSWAVPGQGGLNHINNKSFEYVLKVMRNHGFYWDKNISQQLKNSASLSWLRRNINVFRRQNHSLSVRSNMDMFR